MRKKFADVHCVIQNLILYKVLRKFRGRPSKRMHLGVKPVRAISGNFRYLARQFFNTATSGIHNVSGSLIIEVRQSIRLTNDATMMIRHFTATWEVRSRYPLASPRLSPPYPFPSSPFLLTCPLISSSYMRFTLSLRAMPLFGLLPSSPSIISHGYLPHPFALSRSSFGCLSRCALYLVLLCPFFLHYVLYLPRRSLCQVDSSSLVSIGTCPWELQLVSNVFFGYWAVGRG